MADTEGRVHGLHPHLRVGTYGDSARGEPGVTFRPAAPAAMLAVSGIPAALVGPGASDTPSANASGTVVDRSLAGEPVRFLWLAPGRWLTVSFGLAPDALQALLRAEFRRRPAITDLSHARSLIRIRGPDTGALLAKGCPVDLEAIGSGCAVSTLLGEIRVLIHAIETGRRADLYVPRSLAVSLWEWLCEAAGEFGFRVGSGVEEGPERSR